MKTSYSQNNFLAYLLILASLFISLFFTKNIFTSLQVSIDENEQSKQELQEKQNILTKLNELKARLSQEDSPALKEIQWLSWGFSDKDILEYIYSYVGKVNSKDNSLIIREISFWNPLKSDIGFNKVDISISAIMSSETMLFSFLNYLTSDTGIYRFYISKFSYPMNSGNSTNLQVNIPLTLYYK